jgi:hypothetical protein
MIIPKDEKFFIVKNMIIQGYKSITDFINRKKYPVNVPSNIETPQMYHWSDNQYSYQLYEPIFNSLVPSTRTINDLIDFCNNKIDFQIHVDAEGRNPIFEIEWATKTYLDEASYLEQKIAHRTDPDAQYVKVYIQKARTAYQYFNKMLLKTLKRAKLVDPRMHPIDKFLLQMQGVL